MARWAVTLALLPAVASAQSLEPVPNFGSNPGNLLMFEYVPDGLASGAPLVVLLPGCNQSAADFAGDAGWFEAAHRWGLALVVAEQKLANNIGGCLNWFQPSDNERDQGEAQSIAQMVATAVSTHGLDDARVFAAGISAGACMVAVVLATYPERFAGGAIFAGVPYGCAESAMEGWSCMDPGEDRTPSQWGDLVRAASSHAGSWPVISIWHGSADATVLPINLNESREQWLNVHGFDATPDVDEAVGSAVHQQWHELGSTRVETWQVTGMDHAVPVAPNAGCGSAATFSRDVGICAPDELARLWGLDMSPTDDGDSNDDGGPTADGGPVSDAAAYPGDTVSAPPHGGASERGCATIVPSLWLLLALPRAHGCRINLRDGRLSGVSANGSGRLAPWLLCRSSGGVEAPRFRGRRRAP